MNTLWNLIWAMWERVPVSGRTGTTSFEWMTVLGRIVSDEEPVTQAKFKGPVLMYVYLETVVTY